MRNEKNTSFGYAGLDLNAVLYRNNIPNPLYLKDGDVSIFADNDKLVINGSISRTT